MKVAILIRHGESEANTRNVISEDLYGYPLTKNGRDQAKHTAMQLQGIPVDNLITSPIQRTMETAEIISRIVNVEPKADDRIRESGLGSFNNKRVESLPKAMRSDLGMESWESHQNRFRDVFSEVNGIWVMVSHALPIRAAVCSFLDIDEIESFGVEIRNASMSVIDLENSRVLSIGSLLLSKRIWSSMGSRN